MFYSVQTCTILESIPAFATFYNVGSSHLFVLSMLQRLLQGRGHADGCGQGCQQSPASAK